MPFKVTISPKNFHPERMLLDSQFFINSKSKVAEELKKLRRKGNILEIEGWGEFKVDSVWEQTKSCKRIWITFPRKIATKKIGDFSEYDKGNENIILQFIITPKTLHVARYLRKNYKD